ncbi:MAG: WecB/TagA/CpsF family glycosyltransferase [Pseudomonadota bacterium]
MSAVVDEVSRDDVFSAYPVSTVLGTPIHGMTLEQAVDEIDIAIKSRRRLNIGVVNAAKLVNMRRDKTLRDDVLSSDMILADGAAAVWGSKVLGNPLPERVTGIDLMSSVMARGDSESYRVFLLGASEEISEKVETRFNEMYPGAIIAGRRNGYYSPDEEEAIAHQIRDAKADVLFVAITSPKKENFMATWGDTMNVTVCHGVGGSFDVVAGKVERAPERWQKLGLEWLYRVKQEPFRLGRRYLVTNTLFCWFLLKERLGFKIRSAD